ncbi:glycosyltransferase [Azohydromonas aeria]|uniref:glycosyltransferase n=1 Tax=Azohydromonas aeria TaxID=2590212 RepID=UPI0018DF0043|nr:glycosyltransferase [Azohydromonas aeria]
MASRALGGAERFYIRLVEALARAGQPPLAVTRPDSPVARTLDPAIEQVHLPMAATWDVLSRWRLTRLIAQRRPDIVQTYMSRATRLTRLPAHSPAQLVARLGGFYRVRGAFEHADAWIGNSQAVCDHLLAAGLPAERVTLIGNFVAAPREVPAQDVAALRRQLDIPEHARVLLTLGRMVECKGFTDLLEALALVPDVPGARPLVLVIAGDGPGMAELRAQVAQLGLQARVRLPGWQDDTEPFYALAELFVCSSRREALGNVILEAWRHRLPVLSTRNEGALTLITEDRNGLLAPVRNPAGLAEGLRRLAALSAPEAAALAEAGFDTVEREHGEERVVQAYLELYDRLMRGRAR